MRQRGFDTIQLGLVVAALAILAGVMVGSQIWLSGVKKEAYDKGVADTKVQAEEDRKARDAEVAGALGLLSKKAGDAEAEAAKNKANWQEALRETRRSGKPLGSCADSGPTAQPPEQLRGGSGEVAGNGIRAHGVPGGGPRGVVLHWRFVGLHDGAFSGLDGKPLFAASAQHAGAPERADTPSPYGLDELTEVDGENFANYSACLRDFDEAVSKVEAAEAAWNRGVR